MKLIKTLTITLVISFASLSTAFAFDGKRQGFMLSFGVGSGSLKYEGMQSKYLDSTNRTDEVSTIAFMPKIAYGITDSFVVMYYRHPHNFSVKNSEGDLQELTACAELLGFNYYFSNSNPSLYIGAGSGKSFFLKELNNYGEGALNGKGSAYSVGYEFAKGYSLEFTNMNGTLDENGGEFSSSAVLLNIMWY